MKIVLTSSLLFFTAYAGTIFYNYFQSKDELIEVVVSEQLPETVDIIYHTMSSKLNSGIAVATALAQSEVLIEFLTTGEKDPQKIGSYIGRLKREMNYSFKDLSIDFAGFVSDSTKNFYNTNGILGRLSEDHNWYYNLKNSIRTIGLGINPYSPGQQNYLWVNKKIFDQNGDLLGIDWVAYNIHQLTLLMDDLQIGDNGQTFVIDDNGHIKIHKDQSKVESDDDSDSLDSSLNQRGLTFIENQIFKADSSTFSYYTDDDRIYAYSKLLPFGDWYIVVTASENEILKPLKMAFIRDFITGLIVLMVTTFLSLIFIDRVVIKPIRNLQEGLFGFFDFLNRKTNRVQMTPPKYNDEIGRMIGSINENVNKVKDRIIRENQFIDEINSSVESLQGGQILGTLTMETSHPELTRLRNSFNDLIEILKMKIGRDLNDIIEVMDNYGQLKFDKKLKSVEGEIEKKVTLMGDQIADGVNRIEKGKKALDDKATQLIATNTKLEYAVNELEAFSYSVSHDLKAPLRTIGIYSEILIQDHEDKLNEDARAVLNKIINGTKRMNNIVQDLLMLSKVSRKELSRERIDLSKMAVDIFNELKETDGSKVEIDKDIILNCDPGLTRILLENLIGNAIKFSSKIDAPEIRVVKDSANPKKIKIVDNGAGFNMKYVDRLFKPFQRLHTEEEFNGMGIGLSIVQRIIDKHNGEITVNSEEGVGTEFTFSLS
ncbi:MAG: ATP-binding protein [Cyclobacteriaceae bacterium]